MGKESIPRKHHYIPKFYLRGFSDRGFGDDRGKVCVVDLRAKKHFTCSADNIAHVRDFYAFENSDGEVDFRVEKEFFNGVDGQASQVIGKIERLQEVTLENHWGGAMSLYRFAGSADAKPASSELQNATAYVGPFEQQSCHVA